MVKRGMLKALGKYPNDLEIARRIYESVEATHLGLGRLALFEVLSDIGNRCLLVVGVSGCGKSRVSDEIHRKVLRTKFQLHAVTVDGLKKIASLLSWNDATIIIDDLSKGQTEWSQMATVTVLSGICYSGSLVKYTARLTLEIQGFHGCAIINLQPLLLAKIVKLPEFETDVRDKAIRYYHLHLPVNENINPIRIDDDVKWSDVKDYNFPINGSKRLYNKCFENFMHEFSKARAKEHLNALLCASAWLNNRRVITNADLLLIYELTRIFKLEREIFVKSNLEGAIELDPNVIPLLSMVATFKTPSVNDLMFRFGVKKTRLYEILGNLSNYVLLVRNEGRVIPTEYTVNLLKDIGEW